MTVTENEILKAAIGRTLIPEYDQILENASDEHDFSPRFEKRMQKLIRRRRRPYFKMINTVGKRVAVFAVTFLIISMTTVMSVKALREPFLDFIMSIFTDHSTVSTVSQTDKDYPAAINDKYSITYDLSGFELVYSNENSISNHYEYQMSSTMILYSQIVVSEYQANINTEGAEIEHIDVNGHDAIGFEDNNGYYHLIWNNGEYIIDLGSNIGKDVLIEIAKSVQKVE